MEDRSEDGGFYVPFRDPVFTETDLNKLKAASFNPRISEILNRIFQTQLTGWDVDFSIGRNPVKLIPLRHRIVMGEFWHNPEWDYAKMENGLSRLLCKDQKAPGSWLRIAIRVAVLASSSLELCLDGSETMDVSMVSGDFFWPMSAWYARKWGFPIGNIIMCCNENKSLWELICYGQLKTDAVSITTELPEADVSIPAELERLIYACGGVVETESYLNCCRSGMVYFSDATMHAALQEGNYVSVVSTPRIREIISGALSTHQYLLSCGSALSYGGLMDYQAKNGSLRPAMVICEHSSCRELQKIAGVLGIAVEKLQKYME
jgi:threonine synthase